MWYCLPFWEVAMWVPRVPGNPLLGLRPLSNNSRPVREGTQALGWSWVPQTKDEPLWISHAFPLSTHKTFLRRGTPTLHFSSLAPRESFCIKGGRTAGSVTLGTTVPANLSTGCGSARGKETPTLQTGVC